MALCFTVLPQFSVALHLARNVRQSCLFNQIITSQSPPDFSEASLHQNKLFVCLFLLTCLIEPKLNKQIDNRWLFHLPTAAFCWGWPSQPVGEVKGTISYSGMFLQGVYYTCRAQRSGNKAAVGSCSWPWKSSYFILLVWPPIQYKI